MEFDPNSNPPCYKTKDEVSGISIDVKRTYNLITFDSFDKFTSRCLKWEEKEERADYIFVREAGWDDVPFGNVR